MRQTALSAALSPDRPLPPLVLAGLSGLTTAALSAALLCLLTSQQRRAKKGARPSLQDDCRAVLPSFTCKEADIGEGRKICVLDSGGVHESEAEPVVMIHGFPDNALGFHAVAPLLTAAGHRVLLPSLPGYDATCVSEASTDKYVPSRLARLLQCNWTLGCM